MDRLNPASRKLVPGEIRLHQIPLVVGDRNEGPIRIGRYGGDRRARGTNDSASEKEDRHTTTEQNAPVIRHHASTIRLIRQHGTVVSGLLRSLSVEMIRFEAQAVSYDGAATSG
ncbi:hypothetical protein E0500_002845 [Streptomyces sp. KM273126]|uniref:hypothetical protein n=1 Tax=Streptomyces sp. KM273126 TaxID=2545247 RepID=UPI00103D4544|nr:hypothetical protein [Streptomyces sp. KM273126]MBA2806423.1 hypothetical protein [Streptomyces sp. KM273126]